MMEFDVWKMGRDAIVWVVELTANFIAVTVGQARRAPNSCPGSEATRVGTEMGGVWLGQIMGGWLDAMADRGFWQVKRGDPERQNDLIQRENDFV